MNLPGIEGQSLFGLKIIPLLTLAAVCLLPWLGPAWLPWTSDPVGAASLVTPSDEGMPLYKPRMESSPRARIGGQSRAAETGDPLLIALVPDHVAFTLKGDPALCWYLSAHTSRPITLTVVDSRGIRPILEQSIPSPVGAGIHCTRPRDYGVEFKEQEAYRWFVTLVVDPARPSRDVVAGGVIERVSSDEACALDMPCMWTVCTREAIYRYSESGLWYDAISCLLELIEHGDDKQALREILQHLLNQTGVNLPG